MKEVIDEINEIKVKFDKEEDKNKIDKIINHLNNMNEWIKIVYTTYINKIEVDWMVFFHNINEIKKYLTKFIENNISKIHIQSIEKI